MMKHKSTILIFSVLLMSIFHAQNTNGNWSIIGPVAFPKNVSSQIHGIGRVSQLKFHPSDPNILYTVCSGLWKSTDGGANWQKTGTDKLPSGKFSAVCIDYTDDNIIYLSSGDANYYGNSRGLYKSKDGGATWALSNTSIGNRMCLEILMSPIDHNLLVVATTDGIWRSTNAGSTWTNVKSGGNFTSMKYKPGSSSVIYASTFSDFWKSTDEGVTWTKIDSATPVKGNGGRVAVSDADPNVVYVAYVGSNTTYTDSNNTATAKGGIIYKSTDSGDNFTMIKDDVSPNLNGYNGDSKGQGNYNWDVFADRDNASTLYVVGHVVWKSTDSGATFNKLTDWWIGCHTDMHHIVSSPYNHSKLFNVNDGGIFVSTNGGSIWTPSSDGLSASEIYRFGNSNLEKGVISIGTQDNGELYYNNAVWSCNRGGDWTSPVSFDYYNKSKAYYHSSGKARDIVARTAETSISLPTTASKNDVYVFSKLNTSLAYVSQGTNLIKTTNLLSATPAWTNIKTFSAPIKKVTISPNDDNEIYVVLDNKEIYYSSDGSNFDLKSTLPSSTINYANILVNKNDSNIVYATGGNKIYKSADKASTWVDISNASVTANILNLLHDPYSTDESFYFSTPYGVYYRNKSMSSWASFSQNLPTVANITEIVGYFDGTNNSVIRAAFYGRGVWESSLYSTSLGVKDSTVISDNIAIYQNKDTKIFTISFEDSKYLNTDAILYDMSGRLLKNIKLNAMINLVDFSFLKEGIYIIKFQNGLFKKIRVK